MQCCWGEYSRSGRLCGIRACYQLFIPVREDFQLFQDPRNKMQKNAIVTGVASNTFFEKIPEGGVTFWGQKVIVSSGEKKIFEKKLKKGVTKQGGIATVCGGR